MTTDESWRPEPDLRAEVVRLRAEVKRLQEERPGLLATVTLKSQDKKIEGLRAMVNGLQAVATAAEALRSECVPGYYRDAAGDLQEQPPCGECDDCRLNIALDALEE